MSTQTYCITLATQPTLEEKVVADKVEVSGLNTGGRLTFFSGENTVAVYRESAWISYRIKSAIPESMD